MLRKSYLTKIKMNIDTKILIEVNVKATTQYCQPPYIEEEKRQCHSGSPMICTEHNSIKLIAAIDGSSLKLKLNSQG